MSSEELLKKKDAEKEEIEEEEAEDVKKLEEMVQEEILEEEVKEEEKEEIEEKGEEVFSEAISIIEEVKKEKEATAESLVLSQLSLVLEELEKLSDTINQLNEKMSKLLDNMNMIADSMSEIKSLILMMAPRRPIAVEKGRKIPKTLPSPKEVVKGVKEATSAKMMPRTVNVDKLLEEIESTIYAQEDLIVHAIKIEGLRITVEEILSDVSKNKIEIPEEKAEELRKMLKYLTEESRIMKSKIMALAT